MLPWLCCLEAGKNFTPAVNSTPCTLVAFWFLHLVVVVHLFWESCSSKMGTDSLVHGREPNLDCSDVPELPSLLFPVPCLAAQKNLLFSYWTSVCIHLHHADVTVKDLIEAYSICLLCVEDVQLILK